MTTLTLEAPEDLRDLVWMPGKLQFDNGGESLALIPTRYSGSDASEDGAIALARKTSWESIGEDTYRGLGQRIFATDGGETPILEIRAISLNNASAPAPDEAAGADHA